MKFKGTPTEYRTLHYWVEKQLGKPKGCWDCGDTSDRPYQWANKSGEYKKDISDWERLCGTCHQAKDGFGFIKGDPRLKGYPLLDHCGRGHKLVESNVYIRPSTKYRECIICRKRNHSLLWRTTPKEERGNL